VHAGGQGGGHQGLAGGAGEDIWAGIPTGLAAERAKNRAIPRVVAW
jgi:hypothetical protein